MENNEQIPLIVEEALHNLVYACSIDSEDYPNNQLYNLVMQAINDGKDALNNPERNKRIPMLERLQVSYVCDKCCLRIFKLFYDVIDEIVLAGSVKPGELICPECRENLTE